MLHSCHQISNSSLVLSSKSTSPLYQGAKKWPQHPDVGSPVLARSKITFLDLLAILCLMLPWVSLAFFVARADCWFMLILMSTRIPTSFSAVLLFSWVVPSRYGCLGSFILRCGTWHSHLLNCMKFLSAHFSTFLRFLWTAGQLSFVSHSSQFCMIVKLAEGMPYPIMQIINEDVEWYWMNVEW